jgi:hypothetical protein
MDHPARKRGIQSDGPEEFPVNPMTLSKFFPCFATRLALQLENPSKPGTLSSFILGLGSLSTGATGSRRSARFCAVALGLLVLASLSSAAQTPGSMNIGTLSYNHWPSPSPSIERIRAVTWSSIESSRGTYSSTFGRLDAWIAAAKTHNTRLMYTFYGVPGWAASSSTLPPTDLNAVNEKCQAPLAGVIRPAGDCIWAEFITKFMQHVCGVTAAPATPLKGVCSIRLYESWNEFNADQFWSSNYTNMAKMANDATTIIRKYCGDCTVVAGNSSAGGDGYHAAYVNNPAVSGKFDVSLGEVLDAWHAIPNASLPNAVGYHAYGARRNVIPYPFPETVVSHSSSLCTATNTPNPNCRTAVFSETAAIRNMLKQRTWAANLPIWNTEGGFGRNDDLVDPASQSGANTNMLREAYVARWILAMGSTGTVTNLWYEFDDPCWGTMMGYGIAPSTTGCPTDPEIPPGYTPIHATWNLMNSWLSGASFSGPCTSSGSIWRCYISKTNYHGMFLWTTAWLASQSVPIPSTYVQYRDLNGNIYKLNGATSVTVTNRPILLEQ